MSQTVRIPDGFVEELKARIRPSDVIGRKVKLTKKGKEWVGLSPFTNEKTPSFYVNDQKRIFKCFSSGTGGDVINFIMETERLSFMEAVEKLAEEAGMQLPKASPEAAEAYDHRKRLVAACEAAAIAPRERVDRIAVRIDFPPVEAGALALVRQEVVGRCDGRETFGSLGIVLIAVGMQFLRQLAIGLLDLVLARAARNTE